MRLSRVLLLIVGAALAGCPVEPPEATPVIVRDGGISSPDGGRADAGAGPSGCDEVTPCPAGRACSRDGTCVAPASACTDNDGCAAPDLCVGGSCGLPSGSCVPGTDTCGPDARCYPSGWCGPHARLVDDALASTCRSAADCGLGGVCSFGTCAACTADTDCPGARVCSFGGTCAEPTTCTTSADCLGSNTCSGGTCTPSRAACTVDAANDTMAGATALVEGATLTPTLCGDDVDWWRFTLGAGRHAQVVVRSDPRVVGHTASVTGEDDALAAVSTLAVPGLTVIEVASSTVARVVLLRVASLDAAGPYALSLVVDREGCAGDLLDLYGDTRIEDALELPAGARIERRACPGDVDVARVSASAGDQWRVSPVLLEDGAVTVEVDRLDGTTTTSVAARARYNRGTTTVLRPGAPASAETWAVVMRTENVPASGAGYTLALDRLRGTRVAACASAAVVGAGVTRVALGADIDGPVSCDPIAPRAAFDQLVRIDSPRLGALLHLTARPASVAGARVGLALLEQCTDDASVGGCDFSPFAEGDASLERVLSDTPTWVVISSTTAGEVELTVAFDERGDYTCRLQGATPILASGEIEVDTRGATNTVRVTSEACGLETGDGAGPDRFFALDVGAADRVVLELVGSPGGLLWVGTDCARLTGTCVGSALSARGAPGRVVLPAPGRAQTYVIAVDGVASVDAGTWTLRTRLQPQCIADSECTAPQRCDDFTCVGVPANDRCEGTVVPLVGGRAVIEGSTGAAGDDFVSVGCTSLRSAQDVVYAVDVPAGVAALRARITRADWDPILSIRSTCGTSTAELACNDDDASGSLLPDVQIATPAAGRYFVVVDGYAGAGPFSLELTAL